MTNSSILYKRGFVIFPQNWPKKKHLYSSTISVQVFAYLHMLYSMTVLHYCGQRSPVHAGTADVEVFPVDHPEGRADVAFDQCSRVHPVNLSIYRLEVTRRRKEKENLNKNIFQEKTQIKDMIWVTKRNMQPEEDSADIENQMVTRLRDIKREDKNQAACFTTSRQKV